MLMNIYQHKYWFKRLAQKEEKSKVLSRPILPWYGSQGEFGCILIVLIFLFIFFFFLVNENTKLYSFSFGQNVLYPKLGSMLASRGKFQKLDPDPCRNQGSIPYIVANCIMSARFGMLPSNLLKLRSLHKNNQNSWTDMIVGTPKKVYQMNITSPVYKISKIQSPYSVKPTIKSSMP